MPPEMDDSTPALGNAANAPDPAAEFNAALNEAIDGIDAPGKPAADDFDLGSPQGADEPGEQAPADAAALGEPASGNQPQAGEQSQDVWATAPQPLREAFEALKRDSDLRVRSMAGRHSHLERELQALRQQQQSNQQQPGTQPQDGREPSAGQGTASTGLDHDTIKQLREDYPEVAGPLIDLIAAQQTKLDQLSAPVQQFQQQQATAYANAQEQLLTSQVPDWQHAVRDDRFLGWLDTQPTALREAFQRNVENIVDGADAALVVSKFKADVGFAAAPTPGRAATPPPQDARRNRQLAGGRDIGGNGPPASNTGPSDQDFDGSLNYWLEKAEREASSR